MFYSTLLLAFLALALTAISASPVATPTARVPIPSGAAGVTFVPFAGVGCFMSTNPFSTTKPEVYNLTSSTGCITPSYAFPSYVETANEIAAHGPCSVTIFSECECEGPWIAATLTTFTDCVIPGFTGKSIRMACGP